MERNICTVPLHDYENGISILYHEKCMLCILEEARLQAEEEQREKEERERLEREEKERLAQQV